MESKEKTRRDSVKHIKMSKARKQLKKTSNGLTKTHTSSKPSRKTKKKSVVYEYQMKSRVTWEFADVFKDINSWHESLKGEEDVDAMHMKTEDQIKKEVKEVCRAVLVEDACLENQQKSISDHSHESRSVAQRKCNLASDETPMNEIPASISKSSSNLVDERTAQLSTSDADETDCNEELFTKDTDGATTGLVEALPNVLSKNSSDTRNCRRQSGDITTCKRTDSEKAFTLRGTPEEHRLEAHKNVHPWEKCSNNFPSRIGPDMCNDCPKTFTDNLTVHQRIHSRIKWYKCKDCPRAFPKSHDLTKHERIHSGIRLYKCRDCPKTFSRKQNLTVHQRIHSGCKPYKCKDCPKTFSQKGHLTVHERIHSESKPYKCKDCPKRFSQKSHVKSHERIHSGLKPYKCKDCQKIFSDKSSLTRHERIHSGLKPYKCKDCQKTFSDKSSLTRHERIHSGLKPYKCKDCPKTFSDKSSLTWHERVHSGLAPYKCKECPMTFSQRGNLTRHDERVHSGNRPYKCDDYPKTF